MSDTPQLHSTLTREQWLQRAKAFLLDLYEKDERGMPINRDAYWRDLGLLASFIHDHFPEQP